MSSLFVKLWKKRLFTVAEMKGKPYPTHNKLQHIYNNWVQVGSNGGVLGSNYNISNSYSDFYEKKNQVAYCSTDRWIIIEFMKIFY